MLEGIWVDNDQEMRTVETNSGLIPLSEPYSEIGYSFMENGEGTTTHPTVLINHAIVGWAVLELRSAADPTILLANCAVLVNKDGRLVNAKNGYSPIAFSMPSGSYYVAIRFRSHLPIMTANPIPL